jgi:hypothetical protein
MPPKNQAGLSLENAVFYIALVALAATVGTFFYLQYSVTKSTDELASLTIEATKGKTPDQKELESNVLRVQQELKDFSKMLAAQKASSQLFTKLENMVVSGVYFTKCDINSGTMMASISGHALSFEILGQQISKFESSDEVLGDVTIGNVTIDEDGGVSFEAKVKFNEGTATPQYGG